MYWHYIKNLIKLEDVEKYLNKLAHLAFDVYEIVSIFQYKENVCVIIKFKIIDDNTEEELL